MAGVGRRIDATCQLRGSIERTRRCRPVHPIGQHDRELPLELPPEIRVSRLKVAFLSEDSVPLPLAG